MKKESGIITYLSALVIGILLLCFHEKTNLFEGIVIAMGILITIPSALMLINSFIYKKDAEGVKHYPVWYTSLVAVAGLVLGIWMLVMPSFFVGVAVYTLGVVLILTGLAQIIFLASGSKAYGGVIGWWYAVPVLVITGGFIICFMGPNLIESTASIVTGILLIVYAFNGVASLGREHKMKKELLEIEDKYPNQREAEK